MAKPLFHRRRTVGIPPPEEKSPPERACFLGRGLCLRRGSQSVLRRCLFSNYSRAQYKKIKLCGFSSLRSFSPLRKIRKRKTRFPLPSPPHRTGHVPRHKEIKALRANKLLRRNHLIHRSSFIVHRFIILILHFPHFHFMHWQF